MGGASAATPAGPGGPDDRAPRRAGSKGSGPGSPARTVTAAAVLLEALVAAAYGVFLAVETVVATATERVAAVFLVVIVLALAASLAFLARLVLAGRRAARAPLLVWQVLQLAIALPAVTARWYVGVPLVLLAVVAGLGVLRSDVLPDDDADAEPPAAR